MKMKPKIIMSKNGTGVVMIFLLVDLDASVCSLAAGISPVAAAVDSYATCGSWMRADARIMAETNSANAQKTVFMFFAFILISFDECLDYSIKNTNATVIKISKIDHYGIMC